MEFSHVSKKNLNGLEQMTTQLLKTLRSSKLHYAPLYTELQDFEKHLRQERQNRFDENHPAYEGY